MKTVLKAILNVVKSNLVLKIMAVLFAVILWSYVLSIINPDRTRVVNDVPVSYKGMSELKNNGLVISQSLSDPLTPTSVKIVVKQSDIKLLSKLNSRSLNAYVDLSEISVPGDYPLDVDAVPVGINGQVIETNPHTVKVHVDWYKTKLVPVTVNVIGSVPSGYYASAPEIMTTTVEVNGAQTDVEKVASAVCNVDLTGLTEGYSKSVDIDLLDYEGNVVDKSLFPNMLPSVIVKLNVQSMKTVSVDVASSIVGQYEVAAGYEVAEITCEPRTVTVAGDAQTLLGLNSIGLVPYSIGGKSASEPVALDYQPPEGVTVLTQQKAQVNITIREISKTKTYTDVAIKTKDLGSGLRAQISVPRVDVTAMAGVSAMSKLNRSSIVPYVDLGGLKPGIYSLKVLFEIPKGFTEQNFTASVSTVTVTIS